MHLQLQQAQQLEREGRHAEAIALIREVAGAGDAQAQFMLGAHLIQRSHDERAAGIDVIEQAAANGSAQALHQMAVIVAAGHGRTQDWREALRLLERAAALGDLRAHGQLALLGPSGRFDIAPWLEAPPTRMAFADPRVGVIENFLAPEFCDWVVNAARTKSLERARLVDPKSTTGAAHPGRTNSSIFLNIVEADVIVRLIKARIGAALGLPVGRQEGPNILRYEPGQRFDQHFDFLDPADAGLKQQIAQFGQRTATFLIYLNDDYEGGETAFPLLDWSYRGKRGDALFFWNVSAQGEVERKLLHAGRPPSSGEKWLFSQWVRSQPVEWGVRDEA